MSAISQLHTSAVSGGFSLSEHLTGRKAPVYINNLPDARGDSGLSGCTPQLQELIRDVMPLVWMMMDRHQLQERAVQLFYANPRESLVYNTQKLLKLMQELRGSNHVLVPVSANHSMIFHTLRQVVPCAREMHLEDVSLFYIGDQANRNPLQAISSTCDMSFYFHAQY